MKTTLLILSYNEINGMKAVFPRIRKEWVDEVLVVDGGSTDGSIEYAESLGFKVIRQKKVEVINGFRGNAIVEGFREGLEAAIGDTIINFTPDNNCIPEVIPDMVAKLHEGYDMVVASRYYGPAKSYDDHLISGFGNWFFTTLVNVLFGSRYTDVLGFYRGYRKSIFKELDIDIRLCVSTQMAIRSKQKNLRVIEIPADEPARVGGKTSRSILKNGWMELTYILGEFFKRSGARA